MYSTELTECYSCCKLLDRYLPSFERCQRLGCEWNPEIHTRRRVPLVRAADVYGTRDRRKFPKYSAMKIKILKLCDLVGDQLTGLYHRSINASAMGAVQIWTSDQSEERVRHAEGVELNAFKII
jgi:hypothetical protein